MVMANVHRWYVVQCLCAFALSLATGPASAYDWLQFGGDAQHSGNNTAETAITPANVSALVQKYRVALPATADGAPVFLEGVSTPTGVKDLLFVTTRDGRIMALDAQNGAQLWSQQYGPGTCQINNTGGACYTTSSPAIDPDGQYVYSYGLDGNVHKYQVGDGTEIMTGGWPQLTTLKGFDEKGSSALAIATSNGTSYLYVAHGGYPGDNGDYQGHVTAINLATGSQKVFNAACSDQAVHLKPLADGVPPTCSTPRNAIWSRPAVIYDAGTDLIFMGTGNGVYDGDNNGYDWSESVIALHPDGSGGSGIDAGKPVDSYTPAEFQTLDDGDTDVGSTAPAILPVPSNSTVQHLAVQSGKDGKLRLINLANLSGQGGPGHVGGEIGTVIGVPQGGEVVTQPAVWVNPADHSTWAFVVNGNGASGLRLIVDGNGNPSLSPQWQNVQGGTSPIVANNMVFSISGSTVRALDPLSGNVLWSLARSSGFHWESPIVANGVVYATDGSNQLTAYAVAPSPTTTTLASSVNPSSFGANVTFTASVTGTAPTGTVNFTDGGSSLAGCAAVPLAGSGNTRTAACSTSTLAVGTHSVVATYGGDANNIGSTSSTLSQVVNSGSPPGSLVNPSFEIPALGSSYQRDPSAPGVGWTFSGRSGIQGNGSAFDAAPAPDGTQTAYLQGDNGVLGTISQTLSLNAGSYTLSFQAAQRACCTSPYVQPIQVTVDGTQVGSLVSPPSTSFTVFSVVFSVATSGAHTIMFASTDGSGDESTFIDAVTLHAGGAPSLVNPSFEIPALGSSYQRDPSAPGIGWTFSGRSGIQGNGSAWGAAPAPDGTQTAYLQGDNGVLGTISQTLSLNAGSYTLSFQAAQRACCTAPYVQPVQLTVDGTRVGSLVSPPSTSFTGFSIIFSVATGGAHTIMFASTDGSGDRTSFIDAVTLQ